jgi:hypothetical protein
MNKWRKKSTYCDVLGMQQQRRLDGEKFDGGEAIFAFAGLDPARKR